MSEFYKPVTDDRRTALTLYIAGIAIYSVMYIPQPFLPGIAIEFGVPPAIAALSISVGVAAIALASSWYGPLAETRGGKRVMVRACALLSVPTLLCAVAPSFAPFLIFRALQGLLLPGVASVAVAYIGAQFARERVGQVVSNYIGATVLGGMSGRVVSGLIASQVGWRASFLFFGISTAATALLMATALPKDRAQPISTTNSLRSASRNMWQHLRNRALVGGFAIGGCTFFAFIAVFTYLPFLLNAPPFALPQSVVSSAYVAYLAGAIASPLAGRLSARVSRPRLMAGGMLLAALGIVCTLAHWLPLVLMGMLLLCVGMFTTVSSAPAYVNLTATTAKSGAGALYLTFYYAGATLGSFLPGLAWQSLGWPGVVACALAALALGLLADGVLCRPVAQASALLTIVPDDMA